MQISKRNLGWDILLGSTLVGMNELPKTSQSTNGKVGMITKKIITGVTVKEQLQRAQEILETVIIPQELEYQKRKINKRLFINT